VDDKTIRSIIENNESLDDACRMLIKLANKNGGRDNITALLVAAEETGLLQSLRKMFK